MPRLPNADDLGGLPSVRPNGPLARLNSDTSAYGRGLQAFGEGMQRAAAIVQEQAYRQQQFEAEKNYQKFRWDEQLKFVEAQRNVQPEQIGEFTRTWNEGFRERADEFSENIPDRLKPAYYDKLFSTERGIYADALEFQFAQQKRIAVNNISDATENIYKRRARNVSTEDLPGIIADARSLLDADSSLTAMQKDEIWRDMQREIVLAHLDSQDPYQVAAIMQTWQETGNAPLPAFEMLSDDDRAGIIDGSLNAIQRMEKQALEDNFVRSIIGGEGDINIYDNNERKALDAFYQRQIQDVEPEQRVAIAAELIRGTGYVPDSLVRDIRSGLVSQDAEVIQRSLELAELATSVNPNAFAGRDGNRGVEKAAQFYRSHISQGYSPEETVSRFLQSNDLEYKQKASAVEKANKKWLDSESTPAKFLNDVMDPSYLPFDQPDYINATQEASVAAEYRDILAEALVETGNQDVAKELAAERMKRIYGPSSLNLQGENIVMRYPPERMYPLINGGHQYVVDQLRQLISNVEGLETDRVYLQPDEFTEADIRIGNIPRYQVWYEDENGRPAQLFGGHFIPDIELAKEQAGQSKVMTPRERNLVNRYNLQNPPDYSGQVP